MKSKKNKRFELISLISPEVAKILDVGCSTGGLTAYLKDKGAEVVGIEKDESACKEAGKKLSRVFMADVEKFNLPYPPKYFDCILYGDVLEHLVDPLSSLLSGKNYLSDNGYMLASIPNVRYFKVIKYLVFEGTWDYVDNGILSKWHIRFFSLINIRELLEDAGYEIIEIRRNIVCKPFLKMLNFILFGALTEFLTYQYYVKAKKAKSNFCISSRKRKVHQF